jgi:hypothetical protein
VALAFMSYRVFTFREPAKAVEPAGTHARLRSRPAMAARYRTRTVQISEFVRQAALPRAARRPRLQ